MTLQSASSMVLGHFEKASPHPSPSPTSPLTPPIRASTHCAHTTPPSRALSSAPHPAEAEGQERQGQMQRRGSGEAEAEGEGDVERVGGREREREREQARREGEAVRGGMLQA